MMQFPTRQNAEADGQSGSNYVALKKQRRKFSLLIHSSGALDTITCLASSLSRQGEVWNYLWAHPSGNRRTEKARAKGALNRSGPKKRLNSISLRGMKKDSTFFPQSPYLADHMPGIYKALIATKPAFISYQVYVDQNNYAHYGLPHYREFEYLFVSNEKERENFILAGIPEKRITVSGHPLVFETNLFLQNATDAVRGQKVLLWAPHWELDWSHWEITLAAISEFLDANDDWKVRFRPHPLFLSSLEGKLPAGYRGVSPSSEKSLATLRAFLRSNRIERSRAGLVRDVLECHALITEGKTLPAVWEISGKPMAVISENPEEKFVDYWSSKNERVFLNPRPEHICTRLDQIASSQNASHAVNTNQSPWLLYRDGKPIDPGAVIAETVNL